MKKGVCIDFDGVLNSYSSGFSEGCAPIIDPPVPGAMAFLAQCVEKFETYVFSCRSCNNEGLLVVKDYILRNLLADPTIKDHQLVFSKLNFPTCKPMATMYIDDRAFLFKGTFPTMEEISQFQPWFKRKQPEVKSTIGWVDVSTNELPPQNKTVLIIAKNASTGTKNISLGCIDCGIWFFVGVGTVTPVSATHKVLRWCHLPQ